MVKVGMGQQDRINFTRIKSKRVRLATKKLIRPLKKTTVHKKSETVHFQKMTGTCHTRSRTVKRNFHPFSFLPRIVN
jgi:hypothetical protein